MSILEGSTEFKCDSRAFDLYIIDMYLECLNLSWWLIQRIMISTPHATWAYVFT